MCLAIKPYVCGCVSMEVDWVRLAGDCEEQGANEIFEL